MILVVGEHRDGRLARATLEAVAAARSVGGSEPVGLVLVGAGLEAVANQAATAGVAEVLLVEAPSLAAYTADGMNLALEAAIASASPALVVMAHTYQARDFAPALAARLGRPLVADVTAIAGAWPDLTFSRPCFQGKLSADVRLREPGQLAFVAVQLGAFRVADAPGGTPPSVRRVDVAIAPGAIRQVPEAPFQEARQSVDLSQAERIVAVGRGIKGQEHLAMVESLARALGAEVAASRPICDNGWLPMARQVGSSGQTVAPRLYIALGISGAIQHLVGMKGSRTIVAVNKDPDAPIFEVADYGIVGDLFEVVPAMLAAIEQG